MTYEAKPLYFLMKKLLQGVSQDSRSNFRFPRIAGLRGDHAQLARKDDRDGRGWRCRLLAFEEHVEFETALYDEHGTSESIPASFLPVMTEGCAFYLPGCPLSLPNGEPLFRSTSI